jgi:glycosyltransferase involved in cell wall biosynthesis
MKPRQPTVSIIITCYNYGAYVAQAIDSALAQTHPSVEVVVVDDGSTDNTPEIVQPYKDQILYYRQNNLGVVAARNKGFNLSTGEYICFVDADDYLALDYIERLMQALLAKEALRFAYGDVQKFGIDTAYMGNRPWRPSRLLWTNFIGLCAVVRRTAFVQLSGYDTRFSRQADYEDWEIWLRALQAGMQGVYVPKAVYFYRITKKGGRNRKDLLKNVHLRWRLIRRHWSLYLRPQYVIKAPIEIVLVWLNRKNNSSILPE